MNFDHTSKKTISYLWTALLIIYINSSTQAGETFTNTPRTITSANGNLEIWSEIEYVDKHIDLFDFQSQTSKTTIFEKEKATRLGANWRINNRLALRGSTLSRSGLVTRVTEPKNLKAKQQSWEFGGQFIISNNTALQLTLGAIDFDKQTINKYQQGQIIFGEDVNFLNPGTLNPLPIAELGMKVNEVGLGYFRHIEAHGRLTYDVNINYKYSNLNPDVTSILFGIKDETLLNNRIGGQTISDSINQLRARLPQEDKWQEHIISLGGHVNYPISNTISANMSLQGLWINRQNYIAGDNERQIHNNTVLSAGLAWSPLDRISLYLTAKAYSHYLAGVDAGAYNRRVAHLFDSPYARFSAGLAFSF